MSTSTSPISRSNSFSSSPIAVQDKKKAVTSQSRDGATTSEDSEISATVLDDSPVGSGAGSMSLGNAAGVVTGAGKQRQSTVMMVPSLDSSGSDSKGKENEIPKMQRGATAEAPVISAKQDGPPGIPAAEWTDVDMGGAFVGPGAELQTPRKPLTRTETAVRYAVPALMCTGSVVSGVLAGVYAAHNEDGKALWAVGGSVTGVLLAVAALVFQNPEIHVVKAEKKK